MHNATPVLQTNLGFVKQNCGVQSESVVLHKEIAEIVYWFWKGNLFKY